MLSMSYSIAGQLIDNDVARLKRLGDQRAALVREIQRVDIQIRETSDHLLELHNKVYPCIRGACYT